MPGIRTFIALPTQSNAQQTIAGIQTELKATQAAVKWEPEDKFHITLVFLGNVEQSKIELLSTALANQFDNFHLVRLRMNPLGHFRICTTRVLYGLE